MKAAMTKPSSRKHNIQVLTVFIPRLMLRVNHSTLLKGKHGLCQSGHFLMTKGRGVDPDCDKVKGVSLYLINLMLKGMLNIKYQRR